MLLGAAIFPETRKYGGGPEKMAIDAGPAEMAAVLRVGRELGLTYLQAATF